MSSSNSFNICPKCGSPNAMSAKYCSRCGGELRLPEEPIVCHNCRTRNSPLANFCRNCGAELKVGYATKICARCGSEVSADQSVCTCGYVFAHTEHTAPIPVRSDKSIDTTGGIGAKASGADGIANDTALVDKHGKKEKVKKEKAPKDTTAKGKDGKVYSNKGGRAFAIVALILLAVFAYLIIAPGVARPDVLGRYDKGLTSYDENVKNDQGVSNAALPTQYYGYDAIMLIVKAFTSGAFVDTILNNGGAGQMVIASLVAIFSLIAVIHLIVCVVRIIKPKRSRKPNWLFLAFAALSTIIVGLVVVFNMISVSGFLATVAGVFKMAEGWALGYVLYAIPVYFWLFFLYSLIAKARVLKEETIATPVAAVDPTTVAK